MPTNSGAVSKFQRTKLSPSDPITGPTINSRKPSRLGSRNRYASICRFGFQPCRVLINRDGCRSACVAIAYLDKITRLGLTQALPISAFSPAAARCFLCKLLFVFSLYERKNEQQKENVA